MAGTLIRAWAIEICLFAEANIVCSLRTKGKVTEMLRNKGFFAVLAVLAVLALLPACEMLDQKSESPVGVNEKTHFPDEVPEVLDYPASEWNENIIHADGDSISAEEAARASSRPMLTGVGNYNSFPWGWHLPFRGCWYMTCGYGRGLHQGADYYSTDWAVAGNPCGYEVLAPGAGRVLWTGYKSGYGYTVLIEAGPTGQSNGNRYIYRVAHLSRIEVVPGWWLPRGWRIGRHGSTGTSTDCHIHWTVYRGRYIGYGNVDGSSFPPSWSTGVDGFNGAYGRWCSKQ